MRRRVRNGLALSLALAVALTSTACRRGGEPTDGDDIVVTVTSENVVVVARGRIEIGPSISGSLEPERDAHVRAEVTGSVVQTYADQGQPVERGMLLVRIDDAGLRDEQLSARTAVTAAQESLRLAQRDVERSTKLLAAGAIAERELEDARIAASSAQSQLADAEARLANAEKQLSNTRVRAPFTGIVSERQVSAGDVVQPGTALYTVIDPSSMQLEASVPAAQLNSVHVGAPIEFTVNGYPGRTFAGVVKRISPMVDAPTGQVSITATVPNPSGYLVGGLFAEGWVDAESRVGLIVPDDAVDLSGTVPRVLRVTEGIVEELSVETGLHAERTERIELIAGVAAGDTLLAGAALDIARGTRVRVEHAEPVEPASADGG